MLSTVLSVLCLVGLTTASIMPDVNYADHSYPTTAPGNGTYWVMFSNKLRPGQTVEVRVQILKPKAQATVSASLVKRGKEQAMVLGEAVTKVVAYGEEATLSVEVAMNLLPVGTNWWEANFALMVTGEGEEIKFNHTSPLYYDGKACSIYVQTNKAMYKPLQKVHARILAVDPHLRPIYDPFEVKIKDPEGNLIMRKKNITDPSGIVEVVLPMPDRVPTGQWTIHVMTECGTEVKNFAVDDYVLPKFEVEVDTPPFGLVDDDTLVGTVKAKYNFGKPVTEGDATLEISPRYWNCQYSYYKERKGCEGKGTHNFIILTGKLDRNGEFEFSVNKFRLLDLYNDLNTYNYKDLEGISFNLKGSVLERNTLQTETGEASITYYRHKYKASFLTISPTTYKPNMPWTGYLEVLKQDNSRLTEKERQEIRINVKVEEAVQETVYTPPEERDDEEKPAKADSLSSGSSIGSDGSASEKQVASDASIAAGEPYPGFPGQTVTNYYTINYNNLTLDENGWAVVTHDTQLDAMYITLRATIVGYDRISAYSSLNQAESPTHTYLQLSMSPDTDKLKVGDQLLLTAFTSQPVEVLEYQIFSKGALIDTGRIKSSVASKETKLPINLKQDMVPVVTVIAFYIYGDQHEIVADAVTINVEGLFENPLTMSYDKETVEPGQTVTLTLKQDVGNEASIVKVLSNDKSVTLLATGNDITIDMVQDELLSYTFGYFSPWMRGIAICGMPYYYSGITAADVMRRAGVTMLTDALLYGTYQSTNDRVTSGDTAEESFADESRPSADIAGGDTPQQKTDGAVPAARVRRDFPETWLWHTYIIPAGSTEISVTLTAPDTITSWPTTAFSMHPLVGLTVGEAATSVTTFRDLSVQLDLPNAVIQDEVFCFTTSIFNYYNESIPVMVTLDTSDSYSNVYYKKKGDSIQQRTTSSRHNYINGQIDPDEIDSLMYCLTPTELGDIPVRVNATTLVPGLSDAVERMLTVKAKGSPVAKSEASLISVGDDQAVTVDLSVLEDGVEGSQYITVHVVGNILGTIMDGIEGLLRRPYGCAEQNMINYAPNVFLVNFFQKTDTLTPERLQKAEEYMLIGYNKANMYRDESGGYSSFIDVPEGESPSLWLTDFIIKCFSMSKVVVLPELDLVRGSVNYILAQQSKEGHFVENGRVFNTAMQGGVGSGSVENVSLSSYTMITLLEARELFRDEDEKFFSLISDRLKRVDTFLQDKIDIIKDPYDLCITSYALNMYESKASDKIYDIMMDTAQREQDNSLFWGRPKSTKTLPWWMKNEAAINVEATAYCLLAMMKKGSDESEFLPVVRWLTKQRTSFGEYGSTQATVTSLQALTSLPDKLYLNQGLPYTVHVNYTDAMGQEHNETVEVTEDTQQVVHRLDIPYKDNAPANLKLSATGGGDVVSGTVFSEVIFGQNILGVPNDDPYFHVNHEVLELKNGFILNVSIATTGEEKAGMTILEVDVPAGFASGIGLEPKTVSEKEDTNSKENFSASNDKESETEEGVLVPLPDAIAEEPQKVQSSGSSSQEMVYPDHVSLVENKGTHVSIYINSGVIGPLPITIAVPMYKAGDIALAAADTHHFSVQLYYEPDNKVTMSYTVPLQPQFCSNVPAHTLCQYT